MRSFCFSSCCTQLCKIIYVIEFWWFNFCQIFVVLLAFSTMNHVHSLKRHPKPNKNEKKPQKTTKKCLQIKRNKKISFILFVLLLHNDGVFSIQIYPPEAPLIFLRLPWTCPLSQEINNSDGNIFHVVFSCFLRDYFC